MEKTNNAEKLIINVSAEVRYWEDATINGVEDETGSLVPCRDGHVWKPTIDIASGKILNWEDGTTADIHYKVADQCSYQVIKNGEIIAEQREDYVPDILCPGGNGYGDYIIMEIDENGIIKNWNPDLINKIL